MKTSLVSASTLVILLITLIATIMSHSFIGITVIALILFVITVISRIMLTLSGLLNKMLMKKIKRMIDSPTIGTEVKKIMSAKS
jgi:uncharacterized membrane protein